MTWFAQSANETEAAKEHVCLFIAVSFAFSSGTLRFWTGLGDLTLSGNTYLGAGQMGEIDIAPENVRMVAERKTYRLSGVDPTLASEADIDSCYGRSVTEYFGFMSAAGAIVASPEVLWEGRMDSVRRVDGSAPLIEVNAEHRMALLDKADGWRWTHEHQQLFYAGDKGFDQVPLVETAQVYWGGFPVTTGMTLSPGGTRPPDRNLP